MLARKTSLCFCRRPSGQKRGKLPGRQRLLPSGPGYRFKPMTQGSVNDRDDELTGSVVSAADAMQQMMSAMMAKRTSPRSPLGLANACCFSAAQEEGEWTGTGRTYASVSLLLRLDNSIPP